MESEIEPLHERGVEYPLPKCRLLRWIVPLLRSTNRRQPLVIVQHFP